jgi:uncharacterized DUF497 family protein
VKFSWHEAKRAWVMAERGIDFLRVAFSLFDGRPLLTVPASRGEEERFLSLGSMEGKMFTVIWMAGWSIRIATSSRARDAEEKRYS